MTNETQPVNTSSGFIEKWRREFKLLGWGRENYQQKIRQRLTEEMQLAEGEAIVFAATSGGWIVWVQTPDNTEAGLALAIAGTNRRLVIWTSRALESGLSRFREIDHSELKEVQELTELLVGKRIHQFSGLLSISFREKAETLGIMIAGEKERATLSGFLNEAVSMPAAIVVDGLPEGDRAADTHGERRLMTQKSLTQGLEEVAHKVRALEREKREAVAKAEALEHDLRQANATIEALERAEKQAAATIEALERAEKQAAISIQELEQEKKQAAVTIRGLEREIGELGTLVAQAYAKVEEILKDGTAENATQSAAVNAPEEAKSPEQMLKLSANPQGEPKERASRAWRFD